jgi:hypothetical protein
VAPSKSRGIFCPLILAKKFDAIGDISSGHDDHLKYHRGKGNYAYDDFRHKHFNQMKWGGQNLSTPKE